MVQYFFASSSSRFSFPSVDSTRFSAMRRLSGNFTSPSLHNILTSYLSHICFTVLSRLVLSRLLLRLSGHLFVVHQRHQRGMTLFLNVLSQHSKSRWVTRSSKVARRGLVSGGICYSLPHHIVSCASSHVIGGLLTQSRKSTTSFPCLTELSDSHPLP